MELDFLDLVSAIRKCSMFRNPLIRVRLKLLVRERFATAGLECADLVLSRFELRLPSYFTHLPLVRGRRLRKEAIPSAALRTSFYAG
jgi:hypothetical protein